MNLHSNLSSLLILKQVNAFVGPSCTRAALEGNEYSSQGFFLCFYFANSAVYSF